MPAPLEQTVMLAVIDDERVLLYRRINTWYEEGKFTFPGGMVDEGEAPEAAAVRETFEETGLVIDPATVTLCHENVTEANGRRFHNYYFATHSWSGMLENKEPDRCSELAWYPVKALPESTSEIAKMILKHISHE